MPETLTLDLPATANATTAFVAAAERGRQACREAIDACQAAITQINADRVARGVAPLKF